MQQCDFFTHSAQPLILITFISICFLSSVGAYVHAREIRAASRREGRKYLLLGSGRSQTEYEFNKTTT